FERRHHELFVRWWRIELGDELAARDRDRGGAGLPTVVRPSARVDRSGARLRVGDQLGLLCGESVVHRAERRRVRRRYGSPAGSEEREHSLQPHHDATRCINCASGWTTLKSLEVRLIE